MITLYLLNFLILIIINNKFSNKKNEIFIYLIFGILSPALFFVGDIINISVFHSNMAEKILIIFTLFSSALYYLFNLVNRDIKEVNNIIRNLLIYSLISLNSIELKIIAIAVIIFNYLIENTESLIKFKVKYIFAVIFLIISASNQVQNLFWLQSILLLCLTISICFHTRNIKETVLLFLLLSVNNDLFNFELHIQMITLFPALLIFIPHIIEKIDRERLIEKFKSNIFFEKRLINFYIRKESFVNKNKKINKITYKNKKNLCDQYIIYEKDNNFTFILIMSGVMLCIFFGVII